MNSTIDITDLKNKAKIVIFDSIFLNERDYTMLSDLYNLIDSANEIEVKKILILFANIKNNKTYEKYKSIGDLTKEEFYNSFRYSTIFRIYLMLKIFGKERKIDINFLINDSIHQENYNELIHKFKSFYREESNLLINLVNLHYNKEEEKNSIFYQLKKLFSRLNYLKK